MEFIFEILLDLILEGSLEISSNKKVSKIIRYPLITLIIFFFLLVILGLTFLGVLLLEKNILAGIFIIAIGLFMLASCIIKFKRLYITKTSK